ncbi:MAG: methylated-DNA--[protein]-cysteine S-methyltransferase [Candidatus Shapirobacteria bacterium]|jgi:methylated-DNA-protein-cysteine methyltransferase-like protein
MQIFQKIRHIVCLIPSGKVSTYGAVAKAVGTNPRVVGWALRNNPDMTIPCHRIVKADGSLAAQFSLGNWPEQRRRLVSEGIEFSGNRIKNFPEVNFTPRAINIDT